MDGYFVAAGLNSIGILTGGGIGRAMATWIVDGLPDIDVTGIHVDRLHPYQCGPRYRATRTVESLGSRAVRRLAESGPLTRRLAQVRLLDPQPLMFHGEVVYRDDRFVGYIRVASYGHTLGGAVGLAMIEPGSRSRRRWSTPAPGRWTSPASGSRPSPP